MALFSLTEIFLAVVVLLAYKFASWAWGIWTSPLPPGPTPMPLIGNMNHIFRGGMNNIHLTMTKLASQYGEMFTFYMGPRPVLVLNSYESMRDAFVTHGRQFSGRNKSPVMKIVGKQGGIANSEGRLWKEQRKFALFHLNQLGFGKFSFESKIHEEVVRLLTAVEDMKGEPFDMQPLLSHAVSNVIMSISMGRRYDYSDEQYQTYMRLINENLIAVKRAFLLTDLFPFTQYLPGDFLGFEKIKRNSEIRNEFLQSIVDEHKATFDPANIRDYIDAFLLQMKNDENGDVVDSTFTERQLRQVLMDFFVAGMESTSNTLRWAILYLCENPDVCAKLTNEMDSNVSRDTLPSTRDRSKLPYFESVMTEAMRMGNLSAFGILRAATEDTDFRGYTIPAGTTIIPNVTAIKMDESVFENAQEFRPERFLNEDGAFEKPECFIPFGLGRRSCLGEPLAKMEYFLFLSALFQRFTFTLAEPVSSATGILGITHGPVPYKVRAHLRK